jgi:hypothetical protein
MSILERAVADLADALDTLEAKIGDRFNNEDAGGADAEATTRHIRSARGRAERASNELADAIADLQILIGDAGKDKG